jgi:hypothetical protein
MHTVTAILTVGLLTRWPSNSSVSNKKEVDVFRTRTGFPTAQPLPGLPPWTKMNSLPLMLLASSSMARASILEVTSSRPVRKYKNIAAGHHKVSLIIDDLKSFRPWQPRGIRIRHRGVEQRHLGPGAISGHPSGPWVGFERCGVRVWQGRRKSTGNEKHLGGEVNKNADERKEIHAKGRLGARNRFWRCLLRRG